MNTKGKFKILSYLVEDKLIFYESINHIKKTIAFCLIETTHFHSLLSLLNDFLKKRILKYYSLQLEVNDLEKKIFLLNFEETNKKTIVKFYNLIHQKIKENKLTCRFLKKNLLESKFLHFLNYKKKSELILNKYENSIVIKNHDTKTFLDFYTVNLSKIMNKGSFIYDFLRIATILCINGSLIFHFRVNNDYEIILSTFFMQYSATSEETIEIDTRINEFYNFNLLKKEKIEMKTLVNYFWRFYKSDNSFFFKNFNGIFRDANKFDLSDELKFNSQFELELIKNELEFIRINKNIVFIEQKVLFYSSHDLNYELFFEVLKRYYSKYKIFILILNTKEYSKLLSRVNKINSLRNVRILNPLEFNEFEVKNFKKLMNQNSL